MDTKTVAITEATTVPALDEVRERFEAWRETKLRPNSPTPCELWDAAVSLAGVHPMTLVTKTLRLDPKAFAEKVRVRHDETAVALTGFRGVSTGRPRSIPAFVEVALRPSAMASPAASETAFDPRHEPRVNIEMQLPDGTSLKVSQREPIDAAGFFLDILNSRR